MDAPLEASDRRIPLGLAVAAGILAVVALAGLVLLDTWLADQRWLIYAAAVPVYFLLQVFAEGVMEGLWATRRWVATCFVVAVVVGFYGLWFWLK
jgi:hypothetical protein